MHFGIERVFGIDPWVIIEDRPPAENSAVAESIFSLANEYMGVRGNLEEGFDGESLEGCYIIKGRTRTTALTNGPDGICWSSAQNTPNAASRVAI